jgi:Fic/DOC family protein
MAMSGLGPADGDSTRSTSGLLRNRLPLSSAMLSTTSGIGGATTDDWTPRELGIAAHAETVRVHLFSDGNGRTTRLLADLVFIAAQDPAEFQYDWDVDEGRYIDLLRGFDVHRDVRELAAFIGVQSIEA